jgi:ABC-2 type transport system ATP-binding protein
MRFGEVRALRDVSFSVVTGSICGLVGPNGAGKTTTLRILATDLVASDGEVSVLGQELPLSERKVHRRIGYMPDNAGLYDELTLPEYLSLFASLYGIKGEQRQIAVETAIELSRTDRFVNRRLEGLSRGERQRVLLARALIHDPDFLILDEPASGLDPRGRVELRELLRLLQERGKTILISSHILADLQEICTHLVMIDRGRVVTQGTRESFLASGLQRCRIRIETIGDLEKLLDALQAHNEIVVDDTGLNSIDIEVPADAEFSRDLLRDLVSRDLGVISYERRTESLEDIYLRLTDEEAEPQ